MSILTEHTIPPVSGGKPKCAVIILHGLGDSGSGILSLGQEWASGLPDAEFIAPDAPFVCDMAPFGMQWFSMQDQSSAAILKGVQQAAPIVDSFINEVITTRALTADKVALVGFSQGAIMSLYTAPRRPAASSVAAVLGYSGALIGAETLPYDRRSTPPIMLAHGTVDEVIPFRAMELALAGLQNANLNVITVPCSGLGHSIDNNGLRQGLLFLRKYLIT